MSYKQIPTSAEVWAVIKARHGKELVVFESFSDPDGMFNGRGCMETAYGFRGAREPLMKAATTWTMDPEQPHKRIDERHTYWLCVPESDDAR